MPKCKIKGCKKLTLYKNTKNPYCSMHLARIRRHGYPELKKDAYRSLEKLPHQIIDNFIKNNWRKIMDKEIAKELRKKGFKGATQWTVKYRRRKLGFKKYLSGDVLKHKAWVRTQAIRKYGNKCELCGYRLSLDVHHIMPKKEGGQHEINNLMVLCPNCHAFITRKIFTFKARKDIPKIRKRVIKLLKSF